MLQQREVTILVAEDDAGHARLIEKHLARAGLSNRLLRFEHGQAVLDCLYHQGPGLGCQAEAAYLLLLDIHLPQVDRVVVLRRTKLDPEFRKIPMIMLTTTDDPREVERCLLLGGSSCIVNPVDNEKFAEAIKSLGLYIPLMEMPGIHNLA